MPAEVIADQRYLVRLPDRNLYVSSGALEQCRRVGVNDATLTPWWVIDPHNAGRMTAAEATDVVCYFANQTPNVYVEVVPVPVDE